MSRELKFRVWEYHNKKFTNIPYGVCLNKNFKLDVINDSFDGEVRKYEIQQYIGLIDKNGDEIYEGDIVKFVWERAEHEFEESVGEVFFEDGIFYFSREHQFATNDSNFKKYTLEILGNIIENPELLKNK